MKKTKLTRSLLAACSIVALSAVMYGCVHNGGDDAPATDMSGTPEPAGAGAGAGRWSRQGLPISRIWNPGGGGRRGRGGDDRVGQCRGVGQQCRGRDDDPRDPADRRRLELRRHGGPRGRHGGQ